jgi:hypothetical protein
MVHPAPNATYTSSQVLWGVSDETVAFNPNPPTADDFLVFVNGQDDTVQFFQENHDTLAFIGGQNDVAFMSGPNQTLLVSGTKQVGGSDAGVVVDAGYEQNLNLVVGAATSLYITDWLDPSDHVTLLRGQTAIEQPFTAPLPSGGPTLLPGITGTEVTITNPAYLGGGKTVGAFINTSHVTIAHS